ncbi:MAG: hypothetical protein IDH49_07910 [Gammaproteobacteria bacterium]|nr:hypothetical protein [Gammaproteobacteria bacterium]
MDAWLKANMHDVLIGIEIVWVGGFLAVFVIHFLIWRVIRKRKGAQKIKPPAEKEGDRR